MATRNMLPLAGMLFAFGAIAQVPGPNVNMVSGTQWPTGDPFLQRQNEPSIAVSTRNQQHLLAGANDYRTVDLPFLQDFLPSDKMAGDAWLGVFKSFDGGRTWISNLMPGYPQDASATGIASPMKGFTAAADPVVRAGSHGLFYYSGIVFNRGSNAPGILTVSRFVDTNNKENADTIFFLNSVVVDNGNAGQFVDKPWMAVDVPRAGAGQCTIPAAGEAPAQVIPAGNVYLSYAVFLGSDVVNRSKIMFARSTDCGKTFQNPIKISEGYPIGQGSAVAIDPRNGWIYVVWRKFPVNSSDIGDILFAKSTDGGQTFTKPDTLLGSFVFTPFDQLTTGTSFRSQSLPSMAIDADGRVYVAWSQVGMMAARPNEARVVVSVYSPLTNTWAAPVVADPLPNSGHQIMPALSFNTGKVTLAWYDLRLDHYVSYPVCFGMAYSLANCSTSFLRAGLADSDADVFGAGIDDAAMTARRHTLDIRVAQALPGGPFGPSVLVSQYVQGTPRFPVVTPNPTNIEQLQFNVPNLPMFKLGTVPFMGDYVDVSGSPVFVPVVSGGTEQWVYNTQPKLSTVDHVTWTDNRDVQPPPPGGKWSDYTPPGPTSGTPPGSVYQPGTPRPNCSVGLAGTRNQNIYTSRITQGLVIGTPSNTKPLGSTTFQGQTFLITRAFAVFAQNTTTSVKNLRFAIANQPAGGRASFDEFAPLTAIDVQVLAQSSASRSVYVSSTDPNASVTVTVTDAGQAAGSIILNPSITNPSITNPSITNPSITNPSITNAEIYNPSITNPSITNPSITNPSITNPSITNPSITNPSITNGVIYNPSITNPSITNPSITNPSITNPSITNPSITNPSITNQSLVNGAIADATWTVTNTGNTTSSYDLKLYLTQPLNGVLLQLVVFKIYTSPVASDCDLKEQRDNVVIANVPSPATNPSITNATLALAPGDIAYVTLRVLYPTPDTTVFNPATAIVPIIEAQPVNTPDILNGGTTPTSATPQGLILPAVPLPDAQSAVAYGQVQLNAYGGKQPYIWSSSPLPAGMALNPSSGKLSGIPATFGLYTFIVTVSDSSVPVQTAATGFTLNVLPSGAIHLVVQSQPPNGTAGQPLGSPVTIQALDGLGNPGQGLPVNMSVNPPTVGVLGGTVSGITNTSGNAVFTNLIVPHGGFNLTLAAASPGATGVSSNVFNVTGFNTVGSLSSSRTLLSATRLPSGKVLFFGGLSGGAPVLGEEAYDPATQQIGPFGNGAGSAVYGHTAVLLPAGVVLISAGDIGGNVSTTAQQFIDFFGTVGIAPALTEAREEHTATVLQDGRVLIVGGLQGVGGGFGCCQDAEIFTPPAGPDVVVPGGNRVNHTATLLPNGKVLIAGGFGPGPGIGSSTLLFDPSANTFTPGPPMSVSRQSHTATLLGNGNVLIAGGSGPLATAEIYNPITNSFSPPIPMTAGRSGHTATLLTSGKVLLAGGGSPATQSTAELYDPLTNGFTAAPGLAAPRVNHTAVLLADGSVLIAGNDTSVEIYYP